MEHNRNNLWIEKKRAGWKYLLYVPFRFLNCWSIENCCEIRSKGNSSEEERIHFLMQSAPATR